MFHRHDVAFARVLGRAKETGVPKMGIFKQFVEGLGGAAGEVRNASGKIVEHMLTEEQWAVKRARIAAKDARRGAIALTVVWGVAAIWGTIVGLSALNDVQLEKLNSRNEP